jgi:hypothetical protein
MNEKPKCSRCSDSGILVWDRARKYREWCDCEAAKARLQQEQDERKTHGEKDLVHVR